MDKFEKYEDWIVELIDAANDGRILMQTYTEYIKGEMIIAGFIVSDGNKIIKIQTREGISS